MPKKPNFQLEKGFIDPLSLIGVVFLIATIAVGTAVTNKTDISLSLNKMASTIEDVGMTITGKSYSTKSTPVPTPAPSNPSSLNTQIGKTSTKDSNGKTSSGTSNSNTTPSTRTCSVGRCSGELCKTSTSTIPYSESCPVSECYSDSGCKTSTTNQTNPSSCTCIGGIYTGSGCGSLIDKKCSSSSTDTTSATNTSNPGKQESTSTTETETKSTSETSDSNTTPSTRTCSVGRCSEGSCKISSASVPYSESCPVSECYSDSGCKTSTTSQTSPSSCTCIGEIYTGSGCGSLIDKKCGTQTNTSSNSQSSSCNATILSYTGCGGGGCSTGEVSQTWRTVTCGTATICKPIDECKTATIGSFCEGGKMDPTSSNYCKYGCVPDINGGKCKDAPAATKKETGSTCSSGNECQSGNCYSGSSVLGGSPFDTIKTCRASSIETIDTVTRNTNTIAAAGDLAILGGLAGPAIGEAALAGYSYGTAYLSTLPTSVQTALAIGGTVAGYAGVTAGTIACINNPYSDACVAYIAGIQGDPIALIQLANSTDNLIKITRTVNKVQQNEELLTLYHGSQGDLQSLLDNGLYGVADGGPTLSNQILQTPLDFASGNGGSIMQSDNVKNLGGYIIEVKVPVSRVTLSETLDDEIYYALSGNNPLQPKAIANIHVTLPSEYIENIFPVSSTGDIQTAIPRNEWGSYATTFNTLREETINQNAFLRLKSFLPDATDEEIYSLLRQ